MWVDFQHKLKPFRVFSVADVHKQFPGMNPMNLVRWQEKGYIRRIRNRWYAFEDSDRGDNVEWLAANLIYAPSYVSLHTALSWYNIIPEAIQTTTSVTTRKTNRFGTPLGNFQYHQVKPELFGFGHTLIPMNAEMRNRTDNRRILLATPQKALLDFFYIHSTYASEKDMLDLRLNDEMLFGIINEEFEASLERYANKALESRIRIMKKSYGL
ncbi:MAG: hypothetical protein R2751_07120 [Bacteroidales bacterium]